MITERLRALRENFELTQFEVSEYLQVERSTYSYYESGRTPNLEVLMKLSKLYHVSLDYLAGLDEEPELLEFASPDMQLKEPDTSFHLTDEEKKLVLLFRLCDEPEEILEYVRARCLDKSAADAITEA